MTNIDEILSCDHEEEIILDEDPVKNIMNLSLPLNNRILCFEQYYKNAGDNSIEIINTLSIMYQMSNSKVIEEFFYNLCMNSDIVSSFLKIETSKSLLYNNEKLAYEVLNHTCNDFTDVPVPCRVEAIILLMNSEDYRDNCNTYFCKLICDETINCEFRYKTILSLENKGLELLKEYFEDLFNNKDIVKYVYSNLSSNIINKSKPDINNKKLWYNILDKLSYDFLRNIYYKKWSKECIHDYYIRNASITFLFYKNNKVYHRILSGQYLLQKCYLDNDMFSKVEQQLLDFAQDVNIDYNRRADASDIVLQLGSDESKKIARGIINNLSCISSGKVKTVFENAQNVHNVDIEESITETLEKLNKTKTKNMKFSTVNTKIKNILKDNREQQCCDKKHCEYYKQQKEDSDEQPYFCSDNCEYYYKRDTKIILSLNRIYMDRCIYSRFSMSLSVILVKIWNYIQGHDYEEELTKRLLEELEEMSNTCSTGFVSRLVNVISGYDDFNVRISWEDQIISNFIGRLNAYTRDITNKKGIFYNNKLKEVIRLWLNYEENHKIKNDLENRCTTDNNVISLFISENSNKQINECIEDFAGKVLEEMSLSSYEHHNRLNFLLFFNTYLSKIREELYDEFKDYIQDEDFDFYFRKALMTYDGEN